MAGLRGVQALRGRTCDCQQPFWKFLEDTFLSDEKLRSKVFKTQGREKTLFGDASTASVMYTGGTIRPLVGGATGKVDAIGFHNGQVVACGTNAEVAKQMNALGIQYATIHLSGGQTLIPGMIEPHLHITGTAMMMGWNDFGPFDGQSLRSEYNAMWLTEAVNGVNVPGNYWVLGRGVDPSLMPFEQNVGGLNVLQRFGCDEVDQIRSDVPVLMVSASGHTAYVNTKALQLVYDSSEEMQAKFPTFTEFKNHVNTNGGLQELEEMIPAFGAIPTEQILETINGLKANLDLMFETANKRGVTLMYDAGMDDSSKKDLENYFLTAQPRVKIGYAYLCDSLESAKGLPPYKPPPAHFKNIYMGSVKLISDGSNQGLTGYQNESYLCEPPENYGAFNFPPFSHPDVPAVDFTEIVQTIIDKGWPIMAHANGDKAIDIAVTAYRDALNGSSGLVKRHRIEHCSILSDENIALLSSIGISPSYLIGHVGYWGYAFRYAIFEKKAEQLDRSKSALDNGIRVTLHSDDPVSPMGPLRMMEQAITRIMEGDPQKRVLNENERITAEQALRAVTYDAAWQCHADQWVGSLESGKMADYVILAEDPVSRIDPVGMRNIKVLETWVAGVKVYSAA